MINFFLSFWYHEDFNWKSKWCKI